jgi:hypothetical protein
LLITMTGQHDHDDVNYAAIVLLLVEEQAE